MNVLEAINARMTGGGCPTAGSLGECAAITEIHAEGSARSYYTAHLYLWPAARDLSASEVARWFYQLGCSDVTVSAVLYNKENNIFDGASIDDGVRPWDVSFLPPENPSGKGRPKGVPLTNVLGLAATHPGRSAPHEAGATGPGALKPSRPKACGEH